MTTMPSLTMSEAMVPVKVSPCCVVALSRVWVMRMGRVVPGEGDVAEGGWWWRRRRWRRLHGRWGESATCGEGVSVGADWRLSARTSVWWQQVALIWVLEAEAARAGLMVAVVAAATAGAGLERSGY